MQFCNKTFVFGLIFWSIQSRHFFNHHLCFLHLHARLLCYIDISIIIGTFKIQILDILFHNYWQYQNFQYCCKKIPRFAVLLRISHISVLEMAISTCAKGYTHVPNHQPRLKRRLTPSLVCDRPSHQICQCMLHKIRWTDICNLQPSVEMMTCIPWNVHVRDFPLLSQLSQRYLVIQASSAPSERLFSKAGQIVTPKWAQ